MQQAQAQGNIYMQKLLQDAVCLERGFPESTH